MRFTTLQRLVGQFGVQLRVEGDALQHAVGFMLPTPTRWRTVCLLEDLPRYFVESAASINGDQWYCETAATISEAEQKVRLLAQDDFPWLVTRVLDLDTGVALPFTFTVTIGAPDA